VDMSAAIMGMISGGSIVNALGEEPAFEDLLLFAENLRTELDQTKRDLESAYAELRSTMNELEATNEELQSTEEELETSNDQLNDALRANAFFSSVLASIEQSVIVIDPELRVTLWSDAAAELWGVPGNEVIGEYLVDLDIGLALGDLGVPIRAAIAGESRVENVVRDARNCRGQPIRCSISFSHLSGAGGEGRGAILVMTAEPQSKVDEEAPETER
jgi:two-component system, chemotaxis family, CheB/CheR fusion protein